jgi:hypothetical protein
VSAGKSAQRVVLAVDESGIPEPLIAFAISLCGLENLPLLAQLRLEPGLDSAADLPFVSLVDRSGVAWREWTHREADQSRARLLSRWQERLRTLTAGHGIQVELESCKCSPSEQLGALIARGDFLVMSGSRAAPAFQPGRQRVIVLNARAAAEVTEVARAVCRDRGIPLELWSAVTLDELGARLGGGAGGGVTLVLARDALVASDVQVLRKFLRERGRGLVIVP